MLPPSLPTLLLLALPISAKFRPKPHTLQPIRVTGVADCGISSILDRTFYFHERSNESNSILKQSPNFVKNSARFLYVHAAHRAWPFGPPDPPVIYQDYVRQHRAFTLRKYI